MVNSQFHVINLGSDFSGGTANFYSANTLTSANVWIDEDKSVSVNQLYADSRGVVSFFGDNTYRIRCIDKNNVLLYDWPEVRIVPIETSEMGTNASQYSDLDTAISELGSTETDLIIASPLTVSANAVLPSNIRLVFVNGGSLSNGSNTVTINKLKAGRYQIFDGSGAITINNTYNVFPEWWGIDGTADEVQINNAITSLSAGGFVSLLPKGYYTADSIIMNNPSVILKGAGAWYTSASISGTVIKKTRGFEKAINVTSLSTGIRDLSIDCANQSGDGLYVSGVNFAQFNNVYIYNVAGTGTALYITGSSETVYDHINIRDCYKGIYITSSNDVSLYSPSVNNNSPSSDGHSTCVEIASSVGASFYDLEIGGVSNNAKAIVTSGSGLASIDFYSTYIETSNNNAANTIDIGGSSVYNIGFHGLYMNHSDSSNSNLFMNIGASIRNVYVSNAQFLREQGLTNDFINISNDSEATFINCTSSETSGNNYNFITGASGSRGINVINHVAKGGAVATVNVTGTYHKISNCENTAVTIGASSTNIIVENVDGTITVGSNCLDLDFRNCGYFTQSLTASGACRTYGVTKFNTTAGAISATLADGDFPGQRKILIMETDGGTDVTLTVTNHETSDPEVFTFNDVNDMLILEWASSQWVTIKNSGVGT